ncbi:MAG: ABC transporter ATP-binding protein [Gemmatimonadales bacterium]
MRPYRAAFAVSLLAAVVASTLDGLTLTLLIPFLRLLFDAGAGLSEVPTVVERLLAVLVGGFLETGDRWTALRNVVVLILVAVAAKNVAVYLAGYLGQYIQEGVARDLRNRLFAHIQGQGLAFYHGVRGGQLVSRLVADTDQSKWVVSAALVAVLQNLALVLVYVAILTSLSWRLTLFTLLVVPAVVLSLRPMLRRIRTSVRATLDERGEMTAIVGESVEGARVVKAHGAESYERRRFSDAAERYFRGILKTQRLAVLASPLSETIGAGVIVLLLLAATLVAGRLDFMRPELFVTYLAVALRLMSPLKRLSQFPASAETALGAAERVFEVLDLEPTDVDEAGAGTFPGLRSRIEFRDVWVAYEERQWTLRGVNLSVAKGEVVAIVGPSGAGKSTLADLLPRFVEPTHGAVLLDGVSATAHSRRSLRAQLGVVSQYTVLFNDTVRNNIAYGDQAGADDASVERAARAANAHAFIERLPNGYATQLGERGMRLSGGERQRIAIARALLRDPPILILDEATSHLDAASERLVQEAIGRLLENRTVLVIAHRLSTVARADRIVVLDRGRIVEQGRHEDLMRAGGVYQELLAHELAGA